MSRITYFGPEGTFTEQATRALSGPADELIAADTIPAAMDAVSAHEADAACVPIENSVEGTVPATLDALAEGKPLATVAEVVLPIRFSVLVRSDPESPGEIRTVASHPHALAQVRHWLSEHLPQARQVPAASTAAAAVAVRNGEYDAAITAPVAATHYPLRTYAAEIADVDDAATRFVLLRPPHRPAEPTGADRTSIVTEVDDRVGALSELLVELTRRGINLTKLDARPAKYRMGQYRFFLEFSGHVAEPRVADALAALRRRSNAVRFLGSFPRADAVAATVAPRSDNADFVAATRWVEAVQRGDAS